MVLGRATDKEMNEIMDHELGYNEQLDGAKTSPKEKLSVGAQSGALQGL